MASLNRIVMQKASRVLMRKLHPSTLDAVEVSGTTGNSMPFKSYRNFHYPAHDICQGPFRDGESQVTADLVLANQVWEHLDRPFQATKNVRRMLRKGGHFFIAVPFFIPLHAAPVDNTRWSARGLKNFLIETGFDEEAVSPHALLMRVAKHRNRETFLVSGYGVGFTWPRS